MVGRGPRVALDVDLLRGGLSLFALVNAAGWAALAAAWAFRPEWAERLPLQLGTHERYLKAAPIWARLAASLTGFPDFFNSSTVAAASRSYSPEKLVE